MSVVLLCLAAGCSKTDPDFNRPSDNKHGTPGERIDAPLSNHVILFYFAGHNSLASYMNHEAASQYDKQGDYQDLLEGYIPVNRNNRDDDILLTYTQFPVSYGNYTGELKSHLVRISKDMSGNTVLDTLKTYGSDFISADSKTLNTVLTDVKDLFPAKDYGFLISSHGTGWLPAGYTVDYATESKVAVQKSIGQTLTGKSGSYQGFEMDIKNFAAAFPMKMSYILLDLCLSAGVEVAYQLKDVCDYISFSPTEIMAEGYDYKNLTRRLFNKDGHDVVGVCEDSFALNTASTQSSPYCTISAVDCSKLDKLAEVSRTVFENNRTGLAGITAGTVQGYFQYGWHWFYDFEDILVKAGVSDEEMETFRKALNDCVICNLATDRFLSITIKTHCGLSMYLPCNGNSTLSTYYRDLAWNKATGLVQ